MRYLRASNRSPKTQELYSEAIRQLGKYLTAKRLPLDPTAVTRRTVEDFIDYLFERGCAPATVATRYRGLHAFFKWMAEEEEIAASSMEKTRAPKIPEAPPAVLSEQQVKALLATCTNGTDFRDRRDTALLMLLIDTGARRNEIANLRYLPTTPAQNDVDLDQHLVRVLGKGSRKRPVAIGDKTVRALDRYVRVTRLRPRLRLRPPSGSASNA